MMFFSHFSASRVAGWSPWSRLVCRGLRRTEPESAGLSILLHHVPAGGSVSVVSRVVATQKNIAAHWLLGGIRIFLWLGRQ